MRNLTDASSKRGGGKAEAYSSHQFYLKTDEEMFSMFKSCQDFNVIKHSLDVSEKIEDYFRSNVPHMLPHANVPENDKSFVDFWKKSLPYHASNEAYLAFLARKGLIEKGLGDKPEYVARLKYELRVIWHMDVTDYFLIQREFCNYMHDEKIAFGIRGSGVASLVNYCIGVSDIDPIKWNLMFERFLNPGRGTQYKLDFPEFPFSEWSGMENKSDNRQSLSKIKQSIQNLESKDSTITPLKHRIDKELYVLEQSDACGYLNDLSEKLDTKIPNSVNLWTAYALGITDEKPSGDMIVKEVATLPDVDTDIDDRYRDVAIEWMRQRFGEE
jgi:DNA polymerase III alpha subunit